MSSHGLLKLLNELRSNSRLDYLSLFRNKFDKFDNTGA